MAVLHLGNVIVIKKNISLLITIVQIISRSFKIVNCLYLVVYIKTLHYVYKSYFKDAESTIMFIYRDWCSSRIYTQTSTFHILHT